MCHSVFGQAIAPEASACVCVTARKFLRHKIKSSINVCVALKKRAQVLVRPEKLYKYCSIYHCVIHQCKMM